jgi:hypothetical protein
MLQLIFIVVFVILINRYIYFIFSSGLINFNKKLLEFLFSVLFLLMFWLVVLMLVALKIYI